MYGTHDYLAEYALSFLPAEERAWLQRRLYLYGTELPDSRGYKESINDLRLQHLRFSENGTLLDDSLAKRADQKYDLLLSSLSSGAYGTASKLAGITMSYVSDAGLFSRVVDAKNGLNFERYVEQLTDVVFPSPEFESVFGSYISFDGSLDMISPYDAVVELGRETFLGQGGCSAEWMDAHYDIHDPAFIKCAGVDLNLTINKMADVLHTLYVVGVKGEKYAENTSNTTSPTPPSLQNQTPENQTSGEPAGENQSREIRQEPEHTGNMTIPQPVRYETGGVIFYALVIVLLGIILFFVLRELGSPSRTRSKAKGRPKRKERKK